MSSVALFINSTGLAIFAEADLRWVFMSEKSCRHKLVVSTSFWSWLLNVFSVLTSLKYTATIFWLLMRCEYDDGSYEYCVFHFVLHIFEISLFFCVYP